MIPVYFKNHEYTLEAGDWGVCVLRGEEGTPLPQEVIEALQAEGWTLEDDVLTKPAILNLRLQGEVSLALVRAERAGNKRFLAELMKAGGTNYLTIRPVDPSDLEELVSIVRSQGLSMRLHKNLVRGKFSLELFNIATELLSHDMGISPELTLHAACSTDFAVVGTEIESLGEQVFGSLPDYQSDSIGFLIARDRAILAAGPGTGKTAMSLLAAKHLGLPIQVVCPLTLFEQWHRTARLLGMTISVANPEGLERTMRQDPAMWTNYNSVLIVDESSLYRNRKTKRYALVKKLAAGKKVVWALSGSPIVKSIDQLWAQLNLLDSARWPSYWSFARRYCTIETNRWGTSIVGNLPGADVKLRRNLADTMLSYLSEDVIPLPEWEISVVKCRMGEKQQEVYVRAVKDLRVELVGPAQGSEAVQQALLRRIAEGEQAGRIRPGESAVMFINSSLASTTRCLQIASNPLLVGSFDDSAKWEKCVMLIRRHGMDRERGIVWFSYRTTGEMLEVKLKELGIRVGRLDGSTSVLARKNLLQEFEEGNIRVLLLHPGVAKFGLNLQKASYAIYVERNFDQEAFYQSMYRTKRLGSTQGTKIYFLVSEQENGKPTIDQLVHRALSYQTNTMRKLMVRDLLQTLE